MNENLVRISENFGSGEKGDNPIGDLMSNNHHLIINLYEGVEEELQEFRSELGLRSDSLRSVFKCAILDTGMVLNHPLIKPKLKQSVNLTIEPDEEDRNGHGTVVTLILLKSYGFENIELYNVKVLDSKGESTPCNI